MWWPFRERTEESDRFIPRAEDSTHVLILVRVNLTAGLIELHAGGTQLIMDPKSARNVAREMLLAADALAPEPPKAIDVPIAEDGSEGD